MKPEIMLNSKGFNTYYIATIILLLSSSSVLAHPGNFRDKLEGFDFYRLDDPSIQSIKYRTGRVFEHISPNSAVLWDVIRELKAVGLNPTRVSFDEIDFNDGNGAVDVLRASSADGGGEAWQWLVQGIPKHSPAVRVVYPNGPEQFKVGEKIDVKWTSKTSSGNTIPSDSPIKIILLRSDGVTHTVVDSTQNDDFTQFVIPDYVAQGFYKILLQAEISIPPELGGSIVIEDTSDNFFKVFKSETVNNPPVIEFCDPSSTVRVDETAVARYQVSDPDGDFVEVRIDWGDGTSSIGGLNSATHKYVVAGNYNLKITAKDSKGDVTTSSCNNIRVLPVEPPKNDAPVISFCDPSSTIRLGELATARYQVSDPDGDAVTVEIDWGDGSKSTGGISSETHSYTATGNYNLRIFAKDSRGAITSSSCNNIRVLPAQEPVNHEPVISSCLAETPTVTLGNTARLNYAVSDSDGDSFTVAINWGDGTSSVGTQSSATHIYTSTGTFTVTITATDSRGASTSRNCGTIIVTSSTNNPPVISSCSAPSSISVGSTATISYSISDPENDAFTVTVNWGDGSTTTGTQSSASHTYSSTGAFAVSITATDSRGAASLRNCGSITVSSTAPPSGAAKLKITDVDAKVDGKSSNNLDDNDEISKKAKPESDVEFKVKVDNLFTRTEGIDIENIKVTITIEGIDEDGDDLEEESREFDLSPGDDKKVTLRFKIPLNVEEGNYDVSIEAEGEDENGRDHRDQMDVELEVEREEHDLRIVKLNLNKAVISCNEPFVLSYELMNLAQEDETNAYVEIKNQDLNLNFVEKSISIDSDIDRNKISKSHTLKLSNGISDGTYPVMVRVFSDDGQLQDTKTVSIEVKNCDEGKKPKTKEEKVATQQQISTIHVKGTDTIEEVYSSTSISALFTGSRKNLMLLVLSTFILSIFFLFVAIVALIKADED